jgi:chlorobactene glucosyltransferase
MAYQVIITVGLLVFALNLVLNLRVLKRPSRDSKKLPEPVPLVSVLIPARNEKANIESCLRSLQEQDYPNLEILVLDDNSSDNTASLVERMAATDGRIQLVKGKRLPRGWAGKPFACYQLAKKANGSWLLFVDADTTHASYMLRAVLSLAIERRCAMLSGFPRQLATSLPQKVAVPVLYFIILSWLPLWWLQRSKKPRPSLAIGQFLLFPREEYWRIGGHRAVKSRILEDVWLGVEVNRHGGRHMAVDLSPVVSCRMYQSIGAMWEGFIKWMYSVAALSSLALLGLMIAGFIFFLAPFYWLWEALFVADSSTGWQFLVTLQVVMIIAMRRIADSRFKEPLASALLHPLGFSFLFLACLYGASHRAVGGYVHWKKRLYGRKSGVE